MGTRGKAYDLINSYLSDRKQSVKINGFKSKCIKVEFGVPQGSILSLLLFILYNNDIIENMPKNSVVCYADDTVILATDYIWSLVENKMNLYLSR